MSAHHQKKIANPYEMPLSVQENAFNALVNLSQDNAEGTLEDIVKKYGFVERLSLAQSLSKNIDKISTQTKDNLRLFIQRIDLFNTQMEEMLKANAELLKDTTGHQGHSRSY